MVLVCRCLEARSPAETLAGATGVMKTGRAKCGARIGFATPDDAGKVDRMLNATKVLAS